MTKLPPKMLTSNEIAQKNHLATFVYDQSLSLINYVQYENIFQHTAKLNEYIDNFCVL